MADKGLALVLEECTSIRSRFRRELSWLQWPVLQANDMETGKAERHPVCTKAIELNIDALLAMLDFFGGSFVDISALQNEARVLWFTTDPQ